MFFFTRDFKESEVSFINLLSTFPHRRLALSYRIAHERFADSGALWNYKLCNGSSSASQFSSDEFHRNYKLHVQTLGSVYRRVARRRRRILLV